MTWEILEAYINGLFDLLLTRDVEIWEAKTKFNAFSKDIKEHYDIIEKQN